MALPDTYKQVEYIQSNWNQYIIVWNSFSTDYITEAKFQYLSSGWNDYIFWISQPSPNYRYWFLAWTSQYATISWWSSWTDVGSLDYNINTVILNKSNISINGTSYSLSYLSGTINNKGLWIFCYNSSPVQTSVGNRRLYYLKVYNQSSTVLYNLIPCYRKSDNKPWLYDTVNNVFYTNAGSGSFVVWPTPGQNWEIKKILLSKSLIREKTQPTPSTITEEWWLSDLPLKVDVLISKTWYKIKEYTLEWTWQYSWGSWEINRFFVNTPSWSEWWINMTWQLWGTYWYDYQGWRWPWLWATTWLSWESDVTLFTANNSSIVSQSKNSWIMTVNENTVDYKIWVNFWSWNQTWTITLTWSNKTRIQSMLNAETVYANKSSWNDWDHMTYLKLTVTYESI